MQKTVYEDRKYCMQDVGNIYLGTCYTLGEILGNEEISFKVRLVTERYLLPEADREDTLETFLYYLPKESFAVQIFKQLKAKVKVNLIETGKSLLGKEKSAYVTKTLTVEQLAAMSPEEKEKKGIVIQELGLNKLALMAF